MTTSATDAPTEVPATKAISLDPRLAEAVAMWGQWIITYPHPPAGDMAPPGTDCVPGVPIDKGERIAVHSAGDHGQIVATAVLFDIAHISNAGDLGHTGQSNWAASIEIDLGRTFLRVFEIDPIAANSSWWSDDITDQLPFGNIVPGRWAWLLSDVEMLEQPIPREGGDGVWSLPDDIAEQLTHPKDAA